MKLSEAIRMSGMMKPQGFNSHSMYSVDAPCALGGALQSVGQQGTPFNNAYLIVRQVWPWLNKTMEERRCPVCADSFKHRSDLLCTIFHLNDDHRWTRQQIADWIASVEPPEPATAPEASGVGASASEGQNRAVAAS